MVVGHTYVEAEKDPKMNLESQNQNRSLEKKHHLEIWR